MFSLEIKDPGCGGVRFCHWTETHRNVAFQKIERFTPVDCIGTVHLDGEIIKTVDNTKPDKMS